MSAGKWLPQHVRYHLLDEAYAAVSRSYAQSEGEPGLPPTPGDFADDLAFEFRERLLHLAGARDNPHVLGRTS